MLFQRDKSHNGPGLSVNQSTRQMTKTPSGVRTLVVQVKIYEHSDFPGIAHEYSTASAHVLLSTLSVKKYNTFSKKVLYFFTEYL